jgi:hypothetical protein
MSLHVLALPVLALILGAVAWPGAYGGLSLMPLSLLVPALWVWSTRAWQGALVGAAYHLAASRGLPQGAATYFAQGYFTGLWLWLAAGVLLGATYLVLWCPSRRQRLGRLPLLLVLLAVPPVGVVGWAHPLTAAGYLFPASGWWGLLATGALIMVLAQLPRLRAGWVVLGVVAALQVRLLQVEPAVAPNVRIQGLDTHLAYDTNRRQPKQAYWRQYQLIEQVLAKAAPITLLPESAAGRWDAGKRELWHTARGQLHGRSVLMGGSYRSSPSSPLDNVLIEVSGTSERIVYRQRMPVPVSMWRPWAPKDGFRAAWWANPVFQIDGRRAAALICYEQFLLWPVLHSMGFHPGLLIGIGNVWWSRDTSLPAIQHAALQAWARLFNVPLVTAFNHGEPSFHDEPPPDFATLW